MPSFTFRRCRSTFLHPFYVPIINMLPPSNHISSHLNLFQASWVWGQHIPPKHPFRIVIRHYVKTRKSVLMEGNFVSGLTNSRKKSLRKSKVCHHHFRILPLVLMILFIVEAFMLTFIYEFGVIILCLFGYSLFCDITRRRLVVSYRRQAVWLHDPCRWDQ